jgi:CHASE2 domain-containing sensor protein
MDKKSQFYFRLAFGVVMIGAAIFLSFRYLMKGAPIIKVLAIALIVGTSYLVIDYLKRKSKEE